MITAFGRFAGAGVPADASVHAATGQDASSDLIQANNPLASFNTFNLQNQYTGSLTELDDDDANSFLLRGDLPVSALSGDWLVRATLPINTVPDLTGASDIRDLGDFNIFAAYMIDTGRPALSFAIGPS